MTRTEPQPQLAGGMQQCPHADGGAQLTGLVCEEEEDECRQHDDGLAEHWGTGRGGDVAGEAEDEQALDDEVADDEVVGRIDAQRQLRWTGDLLAWEEDGHQPEDEASRAAQDHPGAAGGMPSADLRGALRVVCAVVLGLGSPCRSFRHHRTSVAACPARPRLTRSLLVTGCSPCSPAVGLPLRLC